ERRLLYVHDARVGQVNLARVPALNAAPRSPEAPSSTQENGMRCDCMRSTFRQASRIRSLTRALACLAIGSLAFSNPAARADEATGAIHVDQPGPRISRYLYGHFLEHLGRAVYDGVWVGPDSTIP